MKNVALQLYPPSRGFTLVELLVVMAVLVLLASLIAPRYIERVDDAREVVLRQNLAGLRNAIDQYYRDKGRYPRMLEDLVTERYIRQIPLDPITNRTDTWAPVPPSASDSTIFDVRSGARQRAKDGTDFGSW